MRPDTVDAEDPTWRAQLTSLAEAITGWTGNDTRLLEYSRAEYAEAAAAGETVLADALRDGVEIGGSLRSLRRLVQARR